MSLLNSLPGESSLNRRFAYYTAILTVVVTVITFGIAFLTPPLSGPWCVENCYEYPYLDIASRFPRDYLWMYPAMLSTALYVVLMACIHRYAPAEKKIFSLAALAFALISATVLLIDYFVQVTVIQPSLVRGETDGISILTQYNPHGVFIALEELGYMLISFSFIFLAPVFSKGGVEKALRWLFISAFVLAMVAFLSIAVMYGVEREYRFELVIISIDWTVMISGGILLARVFKRSGDQPVR